VWGYLRLVPHERVGPGGPAAGAGAPYADRRYADAELVDYTRPGFAVVYLEGEPPGAPPLELAVRAGLAGLRLDPARGALAAGGEVRVVNRSGDPQVVTCPAAQVVRRLAPDEAFAFRVERAGGLELFVLGAQEGAARLFAAPGPFALADADGRYALLDVAPGPARLHAWHPRFPPADRPVELVAGRVERADLELGVGLAPSGGADAR